MNADELKDKLSSIDAELQAITTSDDTVMVWSELTHGPVPNPVEVFVDHESDVEIVSDERGPTSHTFKLVTR